MRRDSGRERSASVRHAFLPALARRPPAGNWRQIDFAQEAYQVYFGRRLRPARANTSKPRPHVSGGTLRIARLGRGFVCDSNDEMVVAVDSLGVIDRVACRRRVEMLLSAKAMTDGYVQADAALPNDDRAISDAPGRGWPEREVG